MGEGRHVARRTDLANGGRHIYFRVERPFLADGPQHVQLKITYLDGPATDWCLEYSGPHGFAKAPSVRTAGTGTWKALTFDVPDITFCRAFAGSMDFRLAAPGLRPAARTP